MMKKALAFLLALVMVLGLVACAAPQKTRTLQLPPQILHKMGPPRSPPTMPHPKILLLSRS